MLRFSSTTMPLFSNFGRSQDDKLDYTFAMCIVITGDPMNQPSQPANGQPFSTLDRDSDSLPNDNCAVKFHGAWWYKGCHGANLNGGYLGEDQDAYADGINWYFFRGHHESMKTTEMKVRGQV